MARPFTARHHLALGALVVCGPFAPGMRSVVVPIATPVSPTPDTAALARDIPRLIRIADIPGLSIAVVRNGQVVWSGAFGTVNDVARTPLGPGTIFEAASLSKPVFGYIVLRLADRGEFDLDRPLFEMLEYPRLAHEERYKRITARMVLSHGTGLPNWGGDTLTLQFDPGTAYGYSGEGFVFLQKTLERVTGRSLEELARREVFQPLGMTHSSFEWQEGFIGSAAYARDWLWRVAPVNRYTEAEANAAASLLTTATDYGRFVAAVLTGRGLSPAMSKAFLTPVRETSPGISMGLGVRIEDGPAGRMFYHSGNNGRRFTSYMTGDMPTGIGFVYFTNAPNGTSLVEALASRVLGTDRQARHRADYDQYDDLRLLALRSVQRAAVTGGAVAARERLRAISASPDTRPSFDAMLELGAFFAGRGLARLAIDVCEGVVAEYPDSAGAHLALGRAWDSAGDLQRAMESYRRAQLLEGVDGDAQRQLQWTENRVAARARPVAVALQTLKRYAGRYQDRVVTLRDGRLYYEGGTTTETSLTPMTGRLFELDADPAMRLDFESDERNPAAKVIGRYADGTIDEWPRSR